MQSAGCIHQQGDEVMNLNLKLAAVAALSLAAVAASAQTKPGATGQFYQNGQPVGPVITLPDCRSCTVKQTGPNTYNVKVPNDVRAKLGMPPVKKSK
jgi:hypothetical protein